MLSTRMSSKKTISVSLLAVAKPAALLVYAALLALVSGFSIGSVAVAQETSVTIVSVEVSGHRNSSANLIKSVASLLPGTSLSSSTVRDAVNRLNGLALFEEISVLAEDTVGGVKLYIIVLERPKLSSIRFQDNKQINDDDLRKTVELSPGSFVSKFDAFSARSAIVKAYAEKGHYLTEVSYTTAYNSDTTSVALIYTIKENEKIKVRDVFISGTVKVEAEQLVGVMHNRKKGFLRSSNYNKDKYPEDLKKVIAEYQRLGYIDAYLISDSTTIDSAVNRMDIYLEVFEGQRYYFGEATFTDNDVFTDKQLAHSLQFKPGDIFNQELYDETVYEIYTAYQETGRLHIRVMDHKSFDDSVISIDYQITEGLPSKVHLVDITGNLKTKDKVIRRELSLRPGQVFHRSLLMRSLRDVMALNYFTNVVPEVKDLPNGDVNIIIEVDEKQTGQLQAGAGYSARDKLVGSLGMGIPNFRGNGQTLNFNVEFGGRRNSTQISFTEPWMFGRPTLFGADIFSLNRTFETVYTEGRRGGSLRVGKRLKWPDNYFRTSLSYRLEGNRFFDFSESYKLVNTHHITTNTTTYFMDSVLVDSASSTYTFFEDTTSTSATTFADPPLLKVGSLLELKENWNIASILSFSITRDSRNLPEFASSGSRFRYTLSKAGGFMGGYWDYTKHFTEFTKFFKIYKGISLAAKVQFGAIQGSDNLRILESERFSPGGTSYLGIVRGYADGSLTPDRLVSPDTTVNVFIDQTGPVDSVWQNTFVPESFNTRDRGRYMLVTNWEISVPLATNTLYFLTFFDAGNSWRNWEDVKPFGDLYSGAGFGFRLAVPGIGTIGFDFAKPLRNRLTNGVLVDNGWRTHFQVGTVFR